jgi:hypothetical protein|tara:strand:+ start:1078 stop:1419 length:342 start_codon:yes stop_codon:yes gene_type:complete
MNDTKFNKADFTWDGMYLMYRGRHSQSVNMEVARPGCHKSWIGLPQPTFIARFKYGNYKPWKAWVNFLVKNASVEEYLKLSDHNNKFHSERYGYETCGSPVHAMETLGYKGKV